MLALALCLAAALATPPVAGDHEAELMRMIAELKADVMQGKEEMAAQRKASQELRRDMSKVRLELVAARGAHTTPRPETTPAPPETTPAPTTPPPDKIKTFFKQTKKIAANLKPLLLNDFMFYTSIVLILQWHIRFGFADVIHHKLFKDARGGKKWTKAQVKPMMTPRRLGLNVLIFVIYYDDQPPWFLEDILHNRPFVCSVGLVFLDTVVLFYSFMILGWSLSKHNHRGTEPAKSNEYIDPLDESEDDGHCPEKFEATNVYEDLTMQFRRVTPVWIVQMALVALYIEQLNKDKDTKDVNQVDYAYWVIAVIFQMHGGDAQVGEPFNALYWNRILNSNMVADLQANVKWLIGGGKDDSENDASKQPLMDDGERSPQHLASAQDLEELVKTAVDKATSAEARRPDSTVNEYLAKLPAEIVNMVLEENTLQETMWRRSFNFVGGCWHKCFWVLDTKICLEWQIRRFMDFTVNSVARGIILYTVPIMVCVEGPLDFVKDLTAVMFMTTLDDSDTKREVEEILVKLKYELYREGSAGDDGENDAEIKISLTDWEKKYAKDAKQSDKFELLTDLDGEHFSHFRGDPRPHEQERV
uniref:Ion transport domain-containing protein n=1 Tax=Alexandrium catenella TaxID=2925 RepID=A0A7S1MAB7_ALECA